MSLQKGVPLIQKKEFRPHPAMKTFLYTMSLLILAVSVLPWSVPVALTTDSPVGKGIMFWTHVATVLVAIWILIWVPRYYKSVTYAIDDEWLYAEGGVFWKRRSRLPISRVQMVDVNQGPWQRAYGLASLRVFTAATGQSTAELSFQNIENAEEIRDYVLSLVQRVRVRDDGLGNIIGERDGAPARDRILVRPDEAQVVQLLDGLLSEVREIRKKLDG